MAVRHFNPSTAQISIFVHLFKLKLILKIFSIQRTTQTETQPPTQLKHKVVRLRALLWNTRGLSYTQRETIEYTQYTVCVEFEKPEEAK